MLGLQVAATEDAANDVAPNGVASAVDEIVNARQIRTRLAFISPKGFVYSGNACDIVYNATCSVNAHGESSKLDGP